MSVEIVYTRKQSLAPLRVVNHTEEYEYCIRQKTKEN